MGNTTWQWARGYLKLRSSAPWQIVHKEQKLVFEGLKNIQLQGCTVLSLNPLWLSLPGKAIKLFFSTSPQKNKNNKHTKNISFQSQSERVPYNELECQTPCRSARSYRGSRQTHEGSQGWERALPKLPALLTASFSPPSANQAPSNPRAKLFFQSRTVALSIQASLILLQFPDACLLQMGSLWQPSIEQVCRHHFSKSSLRVSVLHFGSSHSIWSSFIITFLMVMCD